MDAYANIIVPLPLGPAFTYRIPDAYLGLLEPGMRVLVPFGRSKFYTGIVDSLTAVSPAEYIVKDIAIVLDSEPMLTKRQLDLWKWVAEYYMCSVGEVMRAALPAGMKIESESVVEINPDMNDEVVADILSERELFVWQYLNHNGKCAIDKLGKETGMRPIGAVCNAMIQKGAILISEKIVERFHKKKEICVRFAFSHNDEDSMHKAFDSVRRSPKQEKALVALFSLSKFNSGNPVEVSRASLLDTAGISTAVIRDLTRKGIIEQYTREVSRFAPVDTATKPLPQLSEHQRVAFSQVMDSFLDHNVTLLHGVTGSGKTEIYIHMIQRLLDRNLQVLYLVPEIALTTQLTGRLQEVFGDKVIVYHSKFSDTMRMEIWLRILHSPGPFIVIGARSSVFLPFSHLGLVIVDEEHESSFKQFDPAPRYNARDTAIVLAHMFGARVLLASATPSVETYYKASSGKYGLVSLSKRYADVRLPEIHITDLSAAWKRKEISGPFAKETVEASRNHLDNGKQLIFFQNRRGYAPFVRCNHCGYTPTCTNCDVSLTYHKRLAVLKCHYCGASYPLPDICPQCKEPGLSEKGYGTERIEDDVLDIFPGHKVLRMDLDSTRNKDDYYNIINDFSDHKAEILIGTQMVSKGLDFDNVAMVAVLDADALIHFPEFRASERAFNMIEQVGGRAGRRDHGAVYIQTREPDSPVIKFLQNHDYIGFYNFELEQRRQHCYPPFARIIYIYLKDRDPRALDNVASAYGIELRKLFGNRVFGPMEPLVARVQQQYIRRLMLKIEPQASLSNVYKHLKDVYLRMFKIVPMKGITVYYDVDPQ